MIDRAAAELVRALRDENHLRSFNKQLFNWLTFEDGEQEGSHPDISENRARSLLLTTLFLDKATLGDFSRLLRSEVGPRVATYELIKDTDLAGTEGVKGLVAANSLADSNSADDEQDKNSWLALSVAAFAWKNGYPVHHFDPGAPPAADSPAGHVLKRTAQFIRRQVQKNATEREKLFRTLSQPPSRVPSLDELSTDETEIAPMPPHYRSPVPVQYPEMSSETVRIEADDISDIPSIEVGEPLVISSDDVEGLQAERSEPMRLPQISINDNQVVEESSSIPSPLPSAAVVMPTTTNQSRPSLSMSIRHMFSQESMKSTKLRVIVQQYPDGPGLYGLQVRVMSKGIKSYVAGTTNREGHFLCELPVRMQSGLTYDVQVTWPRDLGGDVERKSITLNADRTAFTLPFYRQINSPNS
ncbi:MAG: hypothetical protein BMS9Abin02_0456 [Anaerolineae bacterium]|nr:MAG: hypothetical protein BMS9Abin02_0456 [Anaerolineae bacterium]